jgi:DNA repair protein RecO (recombination protein O)
MKSLAAFVLHRWDWSESSLILDLLTREQGRIAVAAKGAKRPHSNLRAVLLPFQRVAVTLGRGPEGDGEAEIRNLRGAEWAGGGAMLGGAALFSGFYLNELLMKLVPRQDPHPELFDAYALTLETLAAAHDDAVAEGALRAFELTLLKSLGLLPDLSVATLTQQPLEPGARYALRAEVGVAEPRAGDTGVDAATLVELQAALQHGSVAALQQACASALPELKNMLRMQLHYHLGSPVLRTRRVMVDAQNLER